MASESAGVGQATRVTVSEPTSQAHLGPRKLTTTHAVGQALAIGPIFSVGLVSGLVANVAGFSTRCRCCSAPSARSAWPT